MRGAGASRVLAVASLLVAVAVVATTVLGAGSGSYTLAARFRDAGQLVKGDLVEVAGRRVGTISELRLTDDGLADVVLAITDDELAPLHEGTTAAIRTVGLASVTNRVVALSPGPADAPAIPDGGVLALERTRGIVDLDVLLDAVDPGVRADLRTVISEAAHAVGGDAPRQIGRGLAYLHPALAQLRGLGAEVVRDRGALRRLVRAGAAATGELAARREDLGGGLDGAAAALRDLAAERAALGDALERAPRTLRRAGATLRAVGATLPAVDPVLAGLRPAVAPLARVLRVAPVLARDARPAIAQVRALLPAAREALAQIPGVRDLAGPAAVSLARALRDLLPVITGLRPYAPDFVAGLFNGFGGDAGGSYDANGHYIRISLQGAPSSLPGLLPTPDFSFPSDGYRTGVTARCPGAAEEPAFDGSNPWVAVEGLCDPADGLAASP